MRFFKRGKIPFNKASEPTDPRPSSMALGVPHPPSLQEMVQNAVRHAFQNIQDTAENNPHDWDFEDRPDFESPHELVFDPGLGREVTKGEKAYLDRQRSNFDSYVTKVKRERRAAKQKKVMQDPSFAPRKDDDPKEVES